MSGADSGREDASGGSVFGWASVLAGAPTARSDASSGLAAVFPGALVVGAFMNVWWETFTGAPDPSVPTVHVVSDAPEAKRAFLVLCAPTLYTYSETGGPDQARRMDRMPLRGGVGSAGVLVA
ncbi:hypothetical protein [Streptomyces sp. NPDC091219]|uniref:hypothetical protein n=1 Tax=Streptomyces sp. NPDC091219 TaxID=3155193 RepID=UPI00344D8D11